MGVTAGVGVGLLRAMGRVWWCVERDARVFVADTSSVHNSQHFFDWYSFSHLLHGVVFFWGLWWLVRWLFPSSGVRGRLAWMLAVSVVVEAAWEVLENSSRVIDRYRETAASGYAGDSIVNSLGDLAFCVAGFYLARAMGWWKSLAVFVALELVMLWFIRDNLTLNVLMLAYPFEAVRQWQIGG